jgi:quinolinate synthase
MPARQIRRVPPRASRPYRVDLHQLLDRSESAQRHHCHFVVGGQNPVAIPKDQKIIFGPDKHLGGYLARKTGRDMLLWPGVCIVHEAFSETELVKLKAKHPGAPVAAHPECPAHILDHADYVGSTSGILSFAKDFPGDTLIVATEPHIMHQMEKALPEKAFIGAPGADGNCNCNICPYMALNTMEKLYVALRDLQPRIEIEEGLRLRAKKSLDRMLEMAGSTVGQGDLGGR